MKSCLIWRNGNLGYELNEKLWTPFHNGQIQMLQFTQRLRDKQAKKTEQNTNLASKRMGELAKWKRTLCLFKDDLGQQRMNLSSFFIRSLMFVKSPEISPFPERVFLHPPQPGNSTKHKLDFKGVCLACSGCHEMQIQTMASKGQGELWRCRSCQGAREPMEQGKLGSSGEDTLPAGESKHTSGRDNRDNFMAFSWITPQASPAPSSQPQSWSG